MANCADQATPIDSYNDGAPLIEFSENPIPDLGIGVDVGMQGHRGVADLRFNFPTLNLPSLNENPLTFPPRKTLLALASWIVTTLAKVFLHIIQSGAWLSVMFLALVEKDSTTTFVWRLRAPLPKHLIFNIILMLLNQPTVNVNRLWRQPLRRHRRDDFLPFLELSWFRREPRQF
ncbi:hypothetical protein BDA96_10G194500 [Sorghum bicolor]|uniref:Uncharacterized protein n=1 Tax=Sorghum bicolor TaxID=4558 RepID=A0A921Q3Z8_SORBI|nr:hypothetical protein BDA96_10G194500 [Sorghum bicolor]